ncbi:hypothetical protein HYT23_04475 [Candidatus Pacearchaeota archaeon]|nr:hypothetical protein [Candidatus Pacearchaeota archaeon]
MTWYRFQYVNSGPGNRAEEYFWFDRKHNEKGYIEYELDCWASRIHGDSDRPYSGKFKEVNHPPRAVLEKMIAQTRNSIDNKKQYLSLLEDTLTNMDKK